MAKVEYSNPLSSKPQPEKARAEAEIDRDFALYEHQHALLNGVFEPTRKVKDGRLRLREIKAVHNYINPTNGKVYEGAIHLTLLVPYLLNPQAESVLLALIKLSGKDKLQNGLEIEATQPYLPALFSSIEGDAKDKPMAYIRTSQYQLLKEAGMNVNNEGYRLLNQYLDQMAAVTVFYENTADKFKARVHLLETVEDTSTGNIIVRLNWRLSGAILGKYRYAEIDLKERRALQKDASKTLHRWLSAHLRKGNPPCFYHYETLTGHIWTQEATPTTQRWRLSSLKREILVEIGKLEGWTVEMGKEGVYITHHKAT